MDGKPTMSYGLETMVYCDGKADRIVANGRPYCQMRNKRDSDLSSSWSRQETISGAGTVTAHMGIHDFLSLMEVQASKWLVN